jgi:O-antigen/teichoic acid export membrane protein
MKVEELKLSDAITHVLDECRMVLPGIQALFGFQMIAVFNNAFSEKLTTAQQKLHIVAIALVVIAIALIMAPAAIHREAEPQKASERFIRVSTLLILAAMIPLALAICADVYIVAQLVWHDAVVATALSGFLFVVFFGLWFLYPRFYRREGR